jgi:signal transduction histidine kinase
MSVVLYYAVREVFINIIKHSKASMVNVSICSPNGLIRVTVHDNGVGFDNVTGRKVHERKDSYGLFNIRERIMHLGGKVEINSAPNKGTTVVLTVPAEPANQA